MREDLLRPFDDGMNARRFPAVGEFYHSFVAAKVDGRLKVLKTFNPHGEVRGPVIEVLSVGEVQEPCSGQYKG